MPIVGKWYVREFVDDDDKDFYHVRKVNNDIAIYVVADVLHTSKEEAYWGENIDISMKSWHALPMNLIDEKYSQLAFRGLFEAKNFEGRRPT